MQYNSVTDQIVVQTYGTLIFADPYTLKALSSFSVPMLMSIQVIQNTNFILVTKTYNKVNLFDFIQQKIVLLMDNINLVQTFPDNSQLAQYYSNFYTLTSGDNIVVTTNTMGLFTWGVDPILLNATFYGYIPDSLNGYKTTTVITSMQFVNCTQNGTSNPCLFLISPSISYKAILQFNSDFSTLQLGAMQTVGIASNLQWYLLKEIPVFYISSQYYVTIFNYQTQQFSYALYFYGDYYQRRYIRQQEGQTDRFVFLSSNLLLLYDRGNFALYNPTTQKARLSNSVMLRFGSFYQIKNIFDWYFMKNQTTTQQSLILIFPIYPLNQTANVTNITSSFGLNWQSVNQNLDPYYLNGKFWVALAFPTKAKTENYLFQLINCLSTTERYNLTSNQSDVRSIQTAFAIASLEDASNLELIGIDNQGIIYSWDLSKPNIPFKYSINFSICLNSQIGEIFYYGIKKYLIVTCDNNNAYSFDLLTGKYQKLLTLSSQPIALKTFSKPQLVAIGDSNTGVASIFKFNTITLLFDLFLQLSQSQIYDRLIYIDLLNDYTIWIQYGMGNIFYSIKDCLSDSSLCTQCTQKYYFQATNQYDQNGIYGIGTQDQPFTTSQSFYMAMMKIELTNFSIVNSTFGQTFSILQQQSDIQAKITNLTIFNNNCSNNTDQLHDITSALFSSGQYAVDGVLISQNQFCKKSIFSTITTLQQTNLTFSFSNILVQNNLFQARTTYVFFDAFYSMRQSPSHWLNLNNVQFINNQLFQQSNQDLNIAQYFQTSKIANIQIQNTYLTDHFDIQLGLFENTNQIFINEFYCINNDNYLGLIPNKITAGCLQIKEIQLANFTQIQIAKKQTQDSNLISILNSEIQQANLTLSGGFFSDLQLYQKGVNTQAIPLQIISSYEIQVVLDNCTFQNIFLNSVEQALTFSSTALYILNYVGTIVISNSQFQNSYSNSLYGFTHIQTDTLILDNVTFNNSTFTDDQSLSMFNSQGSMINAKAHNITVMNSHFTKATASKGAFFYFMSIDQLNINFTNAQFSEGYSLLDGGAIFIDDQAQVLNFYCNNCQFSNLFTLSNSASTLGLQKYTQKQAGMRNTIQFLGGYIKNVKGVSDNYFIDVDNTDIFFQDIDQILSEEFSSQEVPYSQYINKTGVSQQSTLINLQNSNLTINNCSITNLLIDSPSASFPLLISSSNSQITLNNTQILNSSFTTSVIYASQTSLDFSSVKFLGISQKISQNRLIQQDIFQTPQASSSSLIVTSKSIINISQDSLFSNIKCTNNCNGGAIQISEGTLNIQNAIFQDIQSTFGGALYIEGINNINQISNTQFSNCFSQNDGGAIYLIALQNDKFSLVLNQTNFIGNSCNSRGGAFYVDSSIFNSAQQSIQIKKSKIINNKASIGGGIYQQNLSVDSQESNIISSNTGSIYGNNDVSYPSQLRIRNIDQFMQHNNGVFNKEYIVINQFRSGANLSDIQFVLMSNKNEIIYPVTSDDYNTFQINVDFDKNNKDLASYQVSGDVLAKYDTGLQAFKFNNITIIGTPGTSANISFTSKQIYTLDLETQKFIQNYTFNILIHFRLCGPGEQINNLNTVTECEICPANYYSFDVSNCQACPQGATCQGGTNMVANQGYWRKSNTSNLLIGCSNLPENCVGGSFGNSICHEGHIGALCEECDIFGEHWGKPYAKSAKYSCTRCDQIKGNVWIVVLVTVWTLLSICLAIKGDVDVLKQKVAVLAIQKNILLRKKSTLNREKRPTMSTQRNIFSIIQQESRNLATPQHSSQVKIDQIKLINEEDNSGILIKMFTNYIQIVGSIATFNLSIPSGIFEFPQSVGQPLSKTMSSLDCALEQINSTIPIIYLRLMFSLAIPIAYLLIFLIFLFIYYIYRNCKKSKGQRYQFPWYILTTAIMFLIIYIQPDLVAQIISLLSCRLIGDTNYILSNVSYVCYTKQHQFYAFTLVIPMLVFWICILPSILFFSLKRNKEKLESTEIKLKYGFLYKEYKSYAFYWEFVKMAQKLAIILVLNFYSQSIITKGILVFIIIASYGILSLIIHPYQESDINEIDFNSTNVCALTVLFGLFMYNNPFFYFVYTSFAIILAINAWFIFKILRKIIRGYIPKFKAALLRAVEALSKRISYFKRFVNKTEQRKIKPEIKQKYQMVFKKILSLTPSQKKKIFLDAIQKQLCESYRHIFGEENNDQNINIQQNRQQQQQQQKEDIIQPSYLTYKNSEEKKNNEKDVSIELASPFSKYQDTVEQLKAYDNKISYETEMLKFDTKEENLCSPLDLNSIKTIKYQSKINLLQTKSKFKIENSPSSQLNQIEEPDQIAQSQDTNQDENININIQDYIIGQSKDNNNIDQEQINLEFNEGEKNITYFQNQN